MSDGDTSKRVARWVRPGIRALSAYHVPDATGLIKLDAMENPYTWPEPLREAWSRRLREVNVNRYPDPHARELAAALRDAMGVPQDAGLLLGNGSDEIIQMLAMTVGGPGRSLLTVEPGFAMYRMIAGFTGMTYAGVPLSEPDFALDTDAVLQAIAEHDPALVFLAVPNNPTGNLFAEADLVRIIEATAGLVVIDEAYAPFTDATLMQRVGEFPNLVVMRTVSKMGLAGLRLGLLAGPREWTDEIDKTRLPYNINVLTQESAAFALEHRAMLDEQTSRIRADREQLFDALLRQDGIRAWPSEANFILFRTLKRPAGAVHAGLVDRSVLVKKLDGAHPLLTDCLRVTVGSPEENRQFLDALAAVLA
jgi:histidinol-phosphate aminotransferase